MNIYKKLQKEPIRWIALVSSLVSAYFIVFYFMKGYTLAYGDAESHLNIAKRVIDGVTPGVAQLGGVWLPFPHLLMIPLIIPDVLWRTGLGGAIVSGICFVISSIFIYKIVLLFTTNTLAGIMGTLVFMSNPNMLYMQSTPMSELPLVVFFTASLYFYFVFLEDDNDLLALIGAGFFAFLATLSRYDGWFLAVFELFVLVALYFPNGIKNHMLEGKAILFSTIGFFGIFLWLVWDKLILGDAFYFMSSPFSAKSQQKGWLLRGELVGYKNLWVSLQYYFVTSLENIGSILFCIACIGLFFFLFDRTKKNSYFIGLLLLVPFIFYVTTMYLGQSIIFIPQLTPASFPWRLFNVRYGIMMVPTAAIFVGYLSSRFSKIFTGIVLLAILVQSALFVGGKIPIITLQDGLHGLSAAAHPDAEKWMRKNYDGGYVILDDYARTISITGSNLPISRVIYIGNKPYWQNALTKPEKYVKWVILQKNDAVWTALYVNPVKRAELYKFYAKTYTSPTILIFKRNST